MIFVDTSAFYARQARRDSHFHLASALWKDLDHTTLITSNHVVEETITLLARRLGYVLAADMAARLYSSEKLDIVSTSRDDELDAIRFFRKFAGQSVSFTDCISFAIMKRNQISTAFTFDRHFRDAGFRVLGLE